MDLQALAADWPPHNGPFGVCGLVSTLFMGALALLWDNGDSCNMATESIPVEVPAVDDELELVANARKGRRGVIFGSVGRRAI